MEETQALLQGQINSHEITPKCGHQDESRFFPIELNKGLCFEIPTTLQAPDEGGKVNH